MARQTSPLWTKWIWEILQLKSGSKHLVLQIHGRGFSVLAKVVLEFFVILNHSRTGNGIGGATSVERLC